MGPAIARDKPGRLVEEPSSPASSCPVHPSTRPSRAVIGIANRSSRPNRWLFASAYKPTRLSQRQTQHPELVRQKRRGAAIWTRLEPSVVVVQSPCNLAPQVAVQCSILSPMRLPASLMQRGDKFLTTPRPGTRRPGEGDRGTQPPALYSGYDHP
jgi:hypothetical protein